MRDIRDHIGTHPFAPSAFPHGKIQAVIQRIDHFRHAFHVAAHSRAVDLRTQVASGHAVYLLEDLLMLSASLRRPDQIPYVDGNQDDQHHEHDAISVPDKGRSGTGDKQKIGELIPEQHDHADTAFHLVVGIPQPVRNSLNPLPEQHL